MNANNALEKIKSYERYRNACLRNGRIPMDYDEWENQKEGLHL